jgi:oligosaccharide repeat unit polymerase
LGITVAVLVFFWGSVLGTRFKPSFVHLIAVIFTLSLIGLYMLGVENDNFHPLYVFEAGLFAFSVGLLAGRLIRSRPYQEDAIHKDVSSLKQRNESLVMLIVGVPVMLLGFALFAVNGVPLFMEGANELRFTVNEGVGVFWRMQQFGLPMMTLIAGMYMMGARSPLFRVRLLFFVFFAATIVTSVLRGHKASLVYALLWVAVLMLVMNRRKIMPKKWIIVFPALLVVSFVVMVLITQQILQMNTQEALVLLGERATTLEAEGFYNIVESYVPSMGLQYGTAQWPSLLGLLATLRLWPRDFTQLELSQLVAHHSYGIPIYSPEFVFPMTLSPFGDFYVDFGVVGVVVGGLVLGMLAQLLYRYTLEAPPSLLKAALIALQVEMVFYASRGSLGGRISNEILNLAVVVVGYYIVRRLLRRFASRPVSKPRIGRLAPLYTRDGRRAHGPRSSSLRE